MHERPGRTYDPNPDSYSILASKVNARLAVSAFNGTRQLTDAIAAGQRRYSPLCEFAFYRTKEAHCELLRLFICFCGTEVCETVLSYFMNIDERR